MADKVAAGVVDIFENANTQAEQDTKAYLDGEFRSNPNLMFRLASFLRNPVIRSIMEGNIARPDINAKPEKAKKLLSQKLTKFEHLGR